MDEGQFWAIIEAGGREALADPEHQLAAARQQLVKLSPEEIRDFHRHFNQKLADAYTWDLWGAGYLINGGCSDDGFYYFRAWLISRGHTVYEATVANLDSLAGLTDPQRDDYEFEDLWGVSQDAYREVTGEEMPAVDFQWPKSPKGEHWNWHDNEQLPRKFPELAKVYLT